LTFCVILDLAMDCDTCSSGRLLVRKPEIEVKKIAEDTLLLSDVKESKEEKEEETITETKEEEEKKVKVKQPAKRTTYYTPSNFMQCDYAR
jgi:hypothetical protein